GKWFSGKETREKIQKKTNSRKCRPKFIRSKNGACIPFSFNPSGLVGSLQSRLFGIFFIIFVHNLCFMKVDRLTRTFSWLLITLGPAFAIALNFVLFGREYHTNLRVFLLAT